MEQVASDSTATKALEATEAQLYSLDGDKSAWNLVKTGALVKDDIKADDVMCIDVGMKIFVTVGNDAPVSTTYLGWPRVSSSSVAIVLVSF